MTTVAGKQANVRLPLAYGVVSIILLGGLLFSLLSFSSALRQHKQASPAIALAEQQELQGKQLNSIATLLMELPPAQRPKSLIDQLILIEQQLSQNHAELSQTLKGLEWEYLQELEQKYEKMARDVRALTEMLRRNEQANVFSLASAVKGSNTPYYMYYEEQGQALEEIVEKPLAGARNLLLLTLLAAGGLLLVMGAAVVLPAQRSLLLLGKNAERHQAHKQEMEAEAVQSQKMMQDLTLKLRQNKDELAKIKSDVRRSVEYAQHIQEAILPLEVLINSYLPENFVLFRPRDVISGDFYWFTERNYKVILAAVDCTGHGIPGGFMSLIGIHLLNEIVNIRAIYEPDKILAELHKGVRQLLQQEITQNTDGMDVSLCVIDNPPKELLDTLGNRKVEFAGAKSPLIYFQGQELNYIKGDPYPVGGIQIDQERVFTKHTIEINQETSLYMFSDGFADQFGGENHKKFMMRRFREMLEEIHERPMYEQKAVMERRLDEWLGDGKQTDDILVIGTKL